MGLDGKYYKVTCQTRLGSGRREAQLPDARLPQRGDGSVRPGKRSPNGCPFICIPGERNIKHKGTEIEKKVAYPGNKGWRSVGCKAGEINQDPIVQLQC